MTAVTTTVNIQLIAERIFNYYLQIINIKKERGVKSFTIDRIREEGKEVPLVHLQDKYDGDSRWRQEALGIKRDDNWHTLPGSFREAFGQTDHYYVDINDVLNEVSKMLTKHGIANYFDTPSIEKKNHYFSELDKQWLYIVL